MINDTGIAGEVGKQLTEDGFEYTTQSNYFGHKFAGKLVVR